LTLLDRLARLAQSQTIMGPGDTTRGGHPAILVVDDEPSSVNLLRITLGLEYTVHTATDGPSALALLAEHPDIAVAIVDQRMPDMSGTEFIRQTIEPYPHLVRIILTGYTDIDSLIDAINAGRVYRYLTKPWNKDDLLVAVRQGIDVHGLSIENLRLQEELRRANAQLQKENVHLRREVQGRYRFDEIVGSSPALRRTLRLLDRVVRTDASVLIYGETGTGKELIARAIHYNGARAEKPFLCLNCGDFTTETLSSELFGHRRGSFTGAVEDRQGLLKAADGGTLFLDEIGDAPESVQTRLLRVLDHGEIRPVGEDHPSYVDVRLIAATNRDLEEEVRAKRFRKDLYFRLNVIAISVPPLRDRREDIPLLVDHFIARLNGSKGRRVLGVTAEVLALLSAHRFEGNVRELENILERAFALADPGVHITPDLLPEHLARGARSEEAAGGGMLRAAVERFEQQLIREVLVENNGNQTQAAAALGLSRRSLIDKLQKYGLR
jgi:two-component system, NtrC family, response regulator HupR/HoxA